MKIKSVVFGISVALTFFVIIPLILIQTNNMLSLPIISFNLSQLLGLTLFLLGLITFIFCSNLFIGLGKGTPVPIEPPKSLVIKKLYRYTRNPIYIGYILMFFGASLFFGHILLFVYASLSILGLNIYVIYFEEPALKKRFGSQYIDYCRTTPRWILKN